MLTKKWMRRSLAMLGALTLTAGLWAAPAMAEEKTYTQPTLNPHVKSIIEVDGYQFIDLNSTGRSGAGAVCRSPGRRPRGVR